MQSGAFVFLLDDHESMGSGIKASSNVDGCVELKGNTFSHIDIARSGVDSFLAFYAKQRLQSALMLLRPTKDKSCIRSYIGDPVDVFEREIKNLDICPSVHTAEADGDVEAEMASPPSDFSYALSTAFSVLNKHRLARNVVDRYGHGRHPSMLEPGAIFVFTNDIGQRGVPLELENKIGVLNDYVTAPQKWDHRVYLFMISSDREETAGSKPSRDLQDLCERTGGVTFVVHSMAEAKSCMLRLLNTLHPPHPVVRDARLYTGTCSVTFCSHKSARTDGDSAGYSDSLCTRGSLHLLRHAEWPIPEDLPMDLTLDTIHARLPLPTMRVHNTRKADRGLGSYHDSDTEGTVAPSLMPLEKCLSFIREYDIPHAIYSVSGPIRKGLQLGGGGVRSCGAAASEVVHGVSMCMPSDADYLQAISKLPGSKDSNQAMGDFSFADYFEKMFGLLVSINDAGSNGDISGLEYDAAQDTQFSAVATTSDGTAAWADDSSDSPAIETTDDIDIYHLYLLPFDFQKCFFLLAQGGEIVHRQKMIMKSGAAAPLTVTTEFNKTLTQWRHDFSSYFKSLPGYYVAPTMNMLLATGLQQLAQIKIAEYKLPTRVINRLNKAAEGAADDIKDMETLSHQKWWLARRQANPAAVALSESAVLQQSLPVGAHTAAIPRHVTCFANHSHSNSTPASVADLAKQWEMLRQVVYGGGAGIFVRGLNVKGIEGSSCYVPASVHDNLRKINSDKRSSLSESSWIEAACGASAVADASVKDMSNYQHVLAQQQCLRETDVESAERDECTEAGIVRRKLYAVNFGNRFKDGKSGSTKGLNRTTSRPGAGDRQSSQLSMPGKQGVENNLSNSNTSASADSYSSSDLFADTPRPDSRASDYSHTFMLEEAVSFTPPGSPSFSGNSRERSSTLHTVTPNTSNESWEFKPEPATRSTQYETSADLPPLGKPPRRGKKRDRQGATVTATSGCTRGSTTSVAETVSSISPSTGTSGIPTSVIPSVPVDKPVPQQRSVSTSAPVDTWETGFSKTHQRKYWYNRMTGKSVWEDPHK